VENGDFTVTMRRSTDEHGRVRVTFERGAHQDREAEKVQRDAERNAEKKRLAEDLRATALALGRHANGVIPADIARCLSSPASVASRDYKPILKRLVADGMMSVDGKRYFTRSTAAA
jgi:hypothetical protein